MTASNRLVEAAACANTPIWGTPDSGVFGTLVNTPAPPVTSIRSDLYARMIALLVKARRDAGLTQVDLGTRIGQRQTFVSKFELGERRLDVAEFVEVARAIGVDPYTVMREAEERG